MPYIAVSQRKPAREVCPLTIGELNYCISMLVQEWIERKGGLRDDALNAAIGVLEYAKLELFRRVVAPYEDKKILEHTDIYSPSFLP